MSQVSEVAAVGKPEVAPESAEQSAVVQGAQTAEREAAKTLKALVKSYRRGETAYRKGLQHGTRNQFACQGLRPAPRGGPHRPNPISHVVRLEFFTLQLWGWGGGGWRGWPLG